MLLVAPTLAQQQPITFQYFYDDLGQLVKVVDSSGNVVEYVYDKVGNMLEIKRSTAASLAIFNFTPSRGPVTTKVTIQGQGFSPTPADNIVRFNGTSAAVTAATATTLAVTVPTGATTGPISVEVGGATTTSSQNFTVTKAPLITSVSPEVIQLGTITVTNFHVTGSNLRGSTFAFVPPAIVITSASIDSSETSATLSLTIGAQTGQFVLVAPNADGSSEAAPTLGNTVHILDPQRFNAEADDDGDGFPNGLELRLGSNPLDRNSIPKPDAFITEVVGLTVSVLNTENPTGGTLPNEAVGPTFSIRNQ
jgi:YD repeat-containing protein